MSCTVSISDRAEADLTNQHRWYLLKANEEVAERFLAAFDRTVKKLAQHPGMGRKRRFRFKALADVRSFPVGDRFAVHIIFFRLSADELTVERVMHGARDLPRRLLEPPE